MKTKSINNQQPLCESTLMLTRLGWQSCWAFFSRLFLAQKRVSKANVSESATSNNSRNEKNSNKGSYVLAGPAGAARTQWVNAVGISKAFPRVIAGFVCLAILAPYADVFYTRLDFNDRVPAEVWYYESYHWLFLCLGPYLKGIFYTIGLYLVFARGSSILSIVAAYALMYDIGKVFWLIQVSNHEEYKSLPTGWFLAYGFIAGCFIILLVDKLTHWLNHRVRAIQSRLQGLRNIADKADPQIIVSGFVRTMDDDVLVQQFRKG